MLRKKKLTPKEQRKKNIRLIVKANQLVEAKYMFDIWEMRFFLSLVADISPSDADEKVYRIWYRDIKKNFELRTNQSYSLLRDAANRLFDKSLVIGYIHEGVEREKKHRLIIGVDYIADTENNKKRDLSSQEYIDVRIDPEIRPYLLDFRKRFDPTKDRYTSYELSNVIHLQTYGVRIYELLKQYERVGHRTIEISKLKEYFNIIDEYPRFSNFFHMVIKRSINDINEKTDIDVPIEEIQKIKKGRKVYALKFPIYSKKNKENSSLREENARQVDINDEEESIILEPETTTADLLFNEFEAVIIKSFGVTPSTFIKLLSTGKYSKEDIEQAISITRRAKYNQDITKSVAGFFLKALKDGYTDEKEEAKKKKAAAKELNAKIETEKNQAINDRIREIVTENPTVTNQAIQKIKENVLLSNTLKEIENTLGRALDIDDYRQNKQLRNLVKRNIIESEKDKFTDIFEKYKR